MVLVICCCRLTYTHHGLSPVNVKFYLTLSGLIEPIPYDGHRFQPNFDKNLINFNEQTTFDIAQNVLSLTVRKLLKRST